MIGERSGPLRRSPSAPSLRGIEAGAIGRARRVVDMTEGRMIGDHLRAQMRQRVIRQRLAEHAGERTQDGPVFLGVALRERGAAAVLDAALGVDPGRVFFGVGGARQDDVGAVRARVAVRAEIDDRAGLRQRDFVDAEQEAASRSRPSASRQRSCRPAPAESRDRDRRRATPRVCSTLKPFQPSRTTPASAASLPAARSTSPRERASADDNHRTLCGLQLVDMSCCALWHRRNARRGARTDR